MKIRAIVYYLLSLQHRVSLSLIRRGLSQKVYISTTPTRPTITGLRVVTQQARQPFLLIHYYAIGRNTTFDNKIKRALTLLAGTRPCSLNSASAAAVVSGTDDDDDDEGSTRLDPTAVLLPLVLLLPLLLSLLPLREYAIAAAAAAGGNPPALGRNCYRRSGRDES